MFAPLYLLGCRGYQNWRNDLFLEALISRFIRVFTDHPGDGDLVESHIPRQIVILIHAFALMDNHYPRWGQSSQSNLAE